MTAWCCGCCGCRLITQSQFNADPAGWKARGFRRHGAHGLCNSCYVRSTRGNTGPARHLPPRPPRDREHVISEWRRLRAAGETHAAIAQRLGMTKAALEGLLKRARGEGLIEATVRSSGGRAATLDPDELVRLRRAVGLPAGGGS